MRMRSPVLVLLGCLSLGLGAVGCKDDKPKQEEKKAEPTPVPSDMVFNDFIPATGGPAGIHARDAGLEGGLADVQGSPGDTTAAEPASDNKLKVTDPGADPKAVRKYTFTAGKVEKRILSLTQGGSQSMAGQMQQQPEQTMKLYLELTPKTVKKEGATIEMKLTKLEVPGAPPQAQQMLQSVAGLTGTFDLTAQGEAGEVSFIGSPAMRNQLAESITQGLSQAAQLLAAPLPDQPIGTGAKWEVPPRPGDPDQGFKHFTAKELSADGGVVEAEIQMKMPRHAQQTQRGTVFLTVDGQGKYNYQMKFNTISPHVDGQLTVNETIEAPAQQGQPKAQMQQVQTVKHVIDTAK